MIRRDIKAEGAAVPGASHGKRPALTPDRKAGGIAGVVAGVGLALEFGLFMASGWTPAVFADPTSALRFLETGGGVLRAAALVGFLNLAFAVVFVAALAGVLAREAATRAATLLYLGLVGIAAHALVPLGLWLGPPVFLELASADAGLAAAGWAGFAAFLDAAGGAGYLFTGIAVAAAGTAIIGSAHLPTLAGWAGLVGGGASAVTVVGTETPLALLASGLYMPALLLTILFRVWVGARLWRDANTDMR